LPVTGGKGQKSQGQVSFTERHANTAQVVF
jgi:hypothetical protein